VRAVRFVRTGGPEVLKSNEVPAPTPGDDEVLVATRAIGVNHADVHFRRGEYFDKPMFPETPGLESAGVILEMGARVNGFRVGERVLCYSLRGAYAEQVAVDASFVYPLPDAISFEDAATLGVQGLTAMHLLGPLGRLMQGESLLVHAAAGGVGSLAVQLARREGARYVIGTAGSEEKRALVRELGADLVLDSRAEFAGQVLRSLPDGVDVVLEMNGGQHSYEANLACMRLFGRMVVYGAAGGDTRGTVAPVRLMRKNLTVSSFLLSSALARREFCRDALRKLFALVEGDLLRVPPRQSLPLSRAADAHALLEGRSSVGKVLLVP
jgi:NADPH:quinone reductase